MPNIKDQLIKLGSANPELKKHIRPILDIVTATESKHIQEAEEIAAALKRMGMGKVRTELVQVVLYHEAFFLEVYAGDKESYAQMKPGYDPNDMDIVYEMEDLENTLSRWGIRKIVIES